MLRFLYVTDLHGWIPGYEAVLGLATECGIRIIVNGGDMFAQNESTPCAQAAFMNGFLCSHFERCRQQGVRYLAMFGNEDHRCLMPEWQRLLARFDNVQDLPADWTNLGNGLQIRGCPFVQDFPAGLKDWNLLDNANLGQPVEHARPVLSSPEGLRPIFNLDAFFAARPTLAQVLDELAEGGPADFRRAIVVTHMPPAGLGLAAICGGKDVGSPSVRAWIERYRPLLTLHGHIHESPDVSGIDTARLGPTVCHQPGQPAPAALSCSVVTVDGLDVRINRRLV